ncbi:MAG TPA: flagellin [Caulobacteraceae bacterium]|jgi:flagellin|nr:flagellin [Caulobacteraceae bacterium]
MSITLNTTSPILTALQDLGGSGASTTGADLIGGQSSTSASGAATAGAVTVAQSGGLDPSAVDADALSLNRATSIADLAVGAGQSVASLLAKLKDDASAAQSPTLDGSARQALNSDFKSTLSQIASTVGQASFDGVNLLDGQGSSLSLPAGGGATLTLSPQNLSLGGPVVTVSAASSLGTPTAATAALADVTNSLGNIETALNALTTQANQVSAHGAILNQLSSVLQAGMTGGDSVDSARLLALQVQQQLSGQSQPIANQSPQLVLSLFR